jgi:hypothetical protein
MSVPWTIHPCTMLPDPDALNYAQDRKLTLRKERKSAQRGEGAAGTERSVAHKGPGSHINVAAMRAARRRCCPRGLQLRSEHIVQVHNVHGTYHTRGKNDPRNFVWEHIRRVHIVMKYASLLLRDSLFSSFG